MVGINEPSANYNANRNKNDNNRNYNTLLPVIALIDPVYLKINKNDFEADVTILIRLCASKCSLVFR